MNKRSSGFTIVELLIVIVVIAILAAIAIVSYNGISNRAKEASLKSDLTSGAKQLETVKITTESYPADTSAVKKSASTTFQYNINGDTFCLGATSSVLPGKAFYLIGTGLIQEGTCPVQVQTVTSANCPASRTMVVDSRDNHTYWIQRLADNKCWMLTNMAYAGGGNNTYSDTKTLVNGVTAGGYSFTSPRYYPVTNTVNFTSSPSAPSTSTDGTGQYGYLYNWCGAMGAQTATSACANALTPAPSTTISVCPSGWRLPVGNYGGEFEALNNAVNGGSGSSDAGLRTSWLGQRGGDWSGGGTFVFQGLYADYWSGTQALANTARSMGFGNTYTSIADNYSKDLGHAVRCVAI